MIRKKWLALTIGSALFIPIYAEASDAEYLQELQMPMPKLYLGLGGGIGNSKLTGEIITGYTLKWGSPFFYSAELMLGTQGKNQGQTPTYGIRILPAYQFFPSTSIYGNVGYIRQVSNGIQLGFGLQDDLTNWFSVRGGYNWNVFKNDSQNYNQFVLTALFRFTI